MDEPSAPDPVVAAGPSRTEVEAEYDASLKSAQPYWQNLLDFRATAQSTYEQEAQEITRLEKSRILQPAVAEARRRVAWQDYSQEIAAINAGPTMQLLTQEYGKQRSRAYGDWLTSKTDAEKAYQSQVARATPPTVPSPAIQEQYRQGAYTTIKSGGDEAGRAELTSPPAYARIARTADDGGGFDLVPLVPGNVTADDAFSYDAPVGPAWVTERGAPITAKDVASGGVELVAGPGAGSAAAPTEPFTFPDFSFKGQEEFFGSLYGTAGVDQSGSPIAEDRARVGAAAGGGAAKGRIMGVGNVYSWY